MESRTTMRIRGSRTTCSRGSASVTASSSEWKTRADIVIAGRVDDRGSHRSQGGGQPPVRGRIARVGQVAGDHDDIGAHPVGDRPTEHIHGCVQRCERVEELVVGDAGDGQVGVGQVARSAALGPRPGCRRGCSPESAGLGRWRAPACWDPMTGLRVGRARGRATPVRPWAQRRLGIALIALVGAVLSVTASFLVWLRLPDGAGGVSTVGGWGTVAGARRSPGRT